MARFDKPWIENLRGATLTVQSPTPDTLFRAIATQIVESRRSSTVSSRKARQRLMALLEQIPCLKNFEDGETLSATWWVQFDLDTTSPIAWRVIRKLGRLLNTNCSSKRMPITFRPVPIESTEHLRWEICSTAPECEPADVCNWLREQLPHRMEDETAWMVAEPE